MQGNSQLFRARKKRKTTISSQKICFTFGEQTKRLEQRLGNLEQLQTKIEEAMKELSELMKKQELASFSIKHSSIEVGNTH